MIHSVFLEKIQNHHRGCCLHHFSSIFYSPAKLSSRLPTYCLLLPANPNPSPVACNHQSPRHVTSPKPKVHKKLESLDKKDKQMQKESLEAESKAEAAKTAHAIAAAAARKRKREGGIAEAGSSTGAKKSKGT